ncbi:GGDEF and EAL domain-containing protein [Granulosicoccaceae sp. 1_MG-2023]|nr:GGDEF and EAL domain-containing protein [Granulosicoccaceae sp. 1_MG-2023]
MPDYMISPDLIDPSLARFVRMTGLICDERFAYALYDEDLSQSWASEGFSGPAMLETAPSADALTLLQTEHEGVCYGLAFGIYRSPLAAFVVLQSPAELSAETCHSLTHQLRVMQGSVAELQHLSGRLEENVAELQHYQHLYNTVAAVRPLQEPESELPELLSDCSASLDLAGVFVYHNDSRQIFEQVDDAAVFEDTGLSPNRRKGIIQRDLYRLCESSSSAFLLERFTDSGASASRNRLESLNILVAPMLDRQSQCIGMLILVRPDSARRFTRSDCRLAELMAERAFRILQSRYDHATGFLNRQSYRQMLQAELMGLNEETPECNFLLLRLDGLDEAYARGGVDAGLHVISQISALLGKRVRSRDLAGRLGKNEFALLLKNCKRENAMIVAGQILESLSTFTFEWQGEPLGIQANIGVVTLTPRFVTAENLFRAGREALESAREEGAGCAAMFTGLTGKRDELARLSWDHRIYKAVIDRQFRLFCQPIEDANAYRDGVRRYELLLRLRSEGPVVVAPYVFISTARKLGLMNCVDQWVASQAFKLSVLSNPDPSTPHYAFTVNLSEDSLTPEFAGYLINEAERLGVMAESICFDLTEAAAMKNLKQATQFIGLLRKRGFAFALDDFGTGIGAYSSLRNLPVDYVKLDGALVKNMSHDPVSAAIVSSLAQVCRSLGIKTIAESVENEATRELLVRAGVDFVQGFQMGRPRAVEKEFDVYREIYAAQGSAAQ